MLVHRLIGSQRMDDKTKSTPGLVLVIYDRLLHWRNREELHPIQIPICNIQAEIDSQDVLGSDNLCFGLVIKNITAIQQSFLEDSGYKSMGEVWMSKVVRNVWDLQNIMWEHSNRYIYESNGTIHHQKEEAMTSAIQWEVSVGQNILPAPYSSLLTGQVQRVLKYYRLTKTQFLSSVSYAWYQVRITEVLGGWESNQMAETFIQKHRRRRKLKLEELSSLLLMT